MYERYTDNARHAVIWGQHEARELQHESTGNEDLLIGILQLTDDICVSALHGIGVTLEAARENVRKMNVPVTLERYKGLRPFAEGAKKSLGFAQREAMQYGHDSVGTEHLLLGIIRHDSDTVKAVYGSYAGTVRQAVVTQMMERHTSKAVEAALREEPTVRSSAEILAEMDDLKTKLRDLEFELDEARKQEVSPKQS